MFSWEKLTKTIKSVMIKIYQRHTCNVMQSNEMQCCWWRWWFVVVVEGNNLFKSCFILRIKYCLREIVIFHKVLSCLKRLLDLWVKNVNVVCGWKIIWFFIIEINSHRIYRLNNRIIHIIFDSNSSVLVQL